MTIDIPYTFVAGTKAKASEVNANFTAVANFVNQLEVANTELDVLIQGLQTSKADLTGSNSNVFRMADALDNYDGVNLRTFKSLTENSKAIINGLIISKQSNTSVNATAGSCWDSTYTSMITTNSSLIADQSNLSANTTYYVYITQDKETKDCELIISLSNASPTLPAGFEYFRLLGKAITDASGNITETVPETITRVVNRFIEINLEITANTVTYLTDYLPLDNDIYLLWVYNNSSESGTIETNEYPQSTIRGHQTYIAPVLATSPCWIKTSRASKVIGAIKL